MTILLLRRWKQQHSLACVRNPIHDLVPCSERLPDHTGGGEAREKVNTFNFKIKRKVASDKKKFLEPFSSTRENSHRGFSRSVSGDNNVKLCGTEL